MVKNTLDTQDKEWESMTEASLLWQVSPVLKGLARGPKAKPVTD